MNLERDRALMAQASLAVGAQHRAESKKDAGELRYLADDHDCPTVMRLAALAEELGEVARAVHDGDRDNLRAELSQLAGIAIAWGIVA